MPSDASHGGAISKRRRHSRDHVLNPKDESHGLSRATAIQFAFGTADPPVVVDSVVERDPHMIKVKTIAELDKLDAARLPPNTHILCDAEDFDHVTRLVKDANRKPVSAEGHFFHPDSRFVEALYDGVACALRVGVRSSSRARSHARYLFLIEFKPWGS